MKKIWFIGISRGKKFFYEIKNIQILIDAAPKDYRIIITTTLPIHYINLESRGYSPKTIKKDLNRLKNKFNRIITTLLDANKNIEYIKWEQLEDFERFNEYKLYFRNNDKLFNKIYKLSSKVLSNSCKREPLEKDIIKATQYLIRECAVIRNIKDYFKIDYCTNAYSKNMNILDILSDVNWLDNWFPNKKI